MENFWASRNDLRASKSWLQLARRAGGKIKLSLYPVIIDILVLLQSHSNAILHVFFAAVSSLYQVTR